MFMSAATIELVSLVGPKLAGEMIADAIVFIAKKYTGGNLATAVEGIATTESGRARFDTLMALNIKAAREVLA